MNGRFVSPSVVRRLRGAMAACAALLLVLLPAQTANAAFMTQERGATSATIASVSLPLASCWATGGTPTVITATPQAGGGIAPIAYEFVLALDANSSASPQWDTNGNIQGPGTPFTVNVTPGGSAKATFGISTQGWPYFAYFAGTATVTAIGPGGWRSKTSAVSKWEIHYSWSIASATCP